ncbi:hypothetical protein Plhal710r2_c020g0085731 [Plasmopara halstedii]
MFKCPRTRAETKRLRNANSKSVYGSGKSEHLYPALMAGTLWFLNVREMVQLLGTCRTLREDKSLGIMALSNCNMGVHLLQGCNSDWMDLFLQNQLNCIIEKSEFWSECKEHHFNPGSKELNGHLMQDKVPLRYSEGQAAHMLSLLGALEFHLKPFYTRAYVATPFGEFCRARPVIVPLPLPHKKRKCAPWTMEHAQSALNTLVDGLGDDFAASTTKYVYVSEVGMHWDNILVGNRDIKSKCGFCSAARKAIRDYRKIAKSMFDEFSDVLRDKQLEWRAQGLDDDEMHERRSLLKATMFPEDMYPDINAAQSTADDILAHICETDQFPMVPFEGMASCLERKNDDIFTALALECQDLCATFYQPLKRSIGTLVAIRGQRLHRSWMDTGEDAARIRRELVAGITSTGFLVGVYIMRAVEDLV